MRWPMRLAHALCWGIWAIPRRRPRLIAEAGPLSGLINNASHFVFDSPGTTTAEQIAGHMGPNLVAPVLLAREFAAQKPERGVIINMLDQKLSNLNPDFFAYTLTKAALAAATDMMAQAFAPNIRVCGISPGLTLPGPKQSPEKFERAWRANPLQRGASAGGYCRGGAVYREDAFGDRDGADGGWRGTFNAPAARRCVFGAVMTYMP